MKKRHIVLLFGGQSEEHEVSVRSAQNIYNALDKNTYDVSLIGITRDGRWHTLQHVMLPQKVLHNSQSNAELSHLFNPFLQESLKSVDVVFPILHGPFGEDGSIQGMLKILNIPFVGPDVLGSAIGMDKDVMKRLLRECNIPIGKFISITYKKNLAKISYEDIISQLGKTLFVKPANLGSSVGVTKVTNERDFDEAVENAFTYDKKILIEEAIEGRELEVAVLGNEDPVASVAGEIQPVTHDFYDYNAKYIEDDAVTLHIPAQLSKTELQQIQFLAIKTFKALHCEGMARVDFFMRKNGELLVNEINTIPGFTNISMYPSLWQASGISYPELLDRLVTLAIERHKRDAEFGIAKKNEKVSVGF